MLNNTMIDNDANISKQIDDTDLKIIDILNRDSSIPFVDVAKRICVSDATVHIRVKRMIAAGIIGGLLAAVFGLIDYLAIPSGTRASRIGLLHGLTNVFVVILFIASWLLRRNSPDVPSTAAFTLSFVGVAAALLGGWLGGELVERLGVSVTPDANLNAPNSLTHSARDTKRAAEDHGRKAAA